MALLVSFLPAWAVAQSPSGIQITFDRECVTVPGVSGVALSESEDRLYCAVWEDANDSRVFEYAFPLPAPGCIPEQTFTFGNFHTHADVVVSQDGQRIFTTNYYPDTVSEVYTATGARTDLPTVSTWPADIAMTPDGTTLVVASGMDGQPVDLGNDNIVVYDIDGGAFSLIGAVPLPDEPRQQMAITEDSEFVYVKTRPRQSSDSMLYEISLDTLQVTRTLVLPSTMPEAHGSVAVQDDQVFVADYGNSSIWVIDRNSWSSQEFPFPIGAPGVVRMHPNGQHLFVLFSDVGTVAAIDIASMSVVATYDQLPPAAHDIEFTASGTQMVICHRNSVGEVVVLNIDFGGFTYIAEDQSIDLCLGGAGAFDQPLYIVEQVSGGPASGIESFSMRLEHDPVVLEATVVAQGQALAALGGSLPDFFQPETCSDFIQLGCVIDFSATATLVADTPAEVAVVSYDVLQAPPPASTELTWANGVGCGTAAVTNVVVVGGISHPVTMDGASISFSTVPCFVRGHCNPDSSLDIGDPTWLLAVLFASGTAPACQDGCDCNDDGALDIGDAICLLQHLFVAGSPPPAPPFPDCAPDPTGDGLDCASVCP